MDCYEVVAMCMLDDDHFYGRRPSVRVQVDFSKTAPTKMKVTTERDGKPVDDIILTGKSWDKIIEYLGNFIV